MLDLIVSVPDHCLSFYLLTSGMYAWWPKHAYQVMLISIDAFCTTFHLWPMAVRLNILICHFSVDSVLSIRHSFFFFVFFFVFVFFWLGYRLNINFVG